MQSTLQYPSNAYCSSKQQSLKSAPVSNQNILPPALPPLPVEVNSSVANLTGSIGMDTSVLDRKFQTEIMRSKLTGSNTSTNHSLAHSHPNVPISSLAPYAFIFPAPAAEVKAFAASPPAGFFFRALPQMSTPSPLQTGKEAVAVGYFDAWDAPMLPDLTELASLRQRRFCIGDNPRAAELSSHVNPGLFRPGSLQSLPFSMLCCLETCKRNAIICLMHAFRCCE